MTATSSAQSTSLRFSRFPFTALESAARRTLARVLIVFITATMLTLVMFWGYLRGSAAPPWDFYSSYTTEAWAWWRDGSLLHQPQWMPYAWGGYPALLNVQNSSWYLPIGLAIALVGPLTIHLAAAISAVEVTAGSVGVYLLLRNWRVRFVPALFGMVSWFFAAGFYSNAEHLDIHRAYAWLPFIFMVIGSAWRWDRWWNWLIAALILWQGLLAIYPGILVALVYVGLAYVATTQIVLRPRVREYLLPLFVAGTAAVLMTLLRYLPFYLVRGSGSPSGADSSAFDPQMLGTFLFPYGSPLLPNDISMRSFFLPAAVFVLIPFANWGARKLRPALVALGVAVVFCFPFWPWHDLLRYLPGMSLSRFTMSDFKPFLLLGMVVIAAAALDRLTGLSASEGLNKRSRSRSEAVRWCVAAVTLAFFIVLATRPAFPPGTTWNQVGLLAVAALLIAICMRPTSARMLGAGALIAITAISGFSGQWATPQPWQADRAQTEVANYGAGVRAMIEQGLSREAAPPPAQRPPRLAPPAPEAQLAQSDAGEWGTAFYLDESSVMAYVNLKGTSTFERIQSGLFDGSDVSRTEALAFWKAGGMLVPDRAGLPTAQESEACATTGKCGQGLIEVPLSASSGDERYRIEASRQMRVLVNDAWYRGWTASACNTGGRCESLQTSEDQSGAVALTIPRGRWIVTLQYRLPGEHASYIAFWLGVLMVVAGTVIAAFATLRRNRRSARRQRSARLWSRATIFRHKVATSTEAPSAGSGAVSTRSEDTEPQEERTTA